MGCPRGMLHPATLGPSSCPIPGGTSLGPCMEGGWVAEPHAGLVTSCGGSGADGSPPPCGSDYRKNRAG